MKPVYWWPTLLVLDGANFCGTTSLHFATLCFLAVLKNLLTLPRFLIYTGVEHTALFYLSLTKNVVGLYKKYQENVKKNTFFFIRNSSIRNSTEILQTNKKHQYWDLP